MECLELEQTSIKEVPQSIAGKLKVLSLCGCSKMTKFPEILGDIEVLHLSGAAIKEVPSSIQFLIRLYKLDMNGCSKLESFLEITVPMKSLEQLYLSETGIKEIPSISFKHMISLKILELDGTPLKELPSSIQFLTRLYKLDMSGCSKLESFPEITVPMESLQVLYLSEAVIKEIPSISFKHMPSLKILKLDGTPLKELPSSIQFLTRLERLDMSGCSKLESFPEITVPMESLQHLYLSEAGIKEIPSISFKHMPSLKILKLDGTPLKELPSSIQFLTRLEMLDMSGCSKLESFQEITMPMKSLVKLNLSKTGIKEIPSSLIKHMISLTCLDLDGTPIKEIPLSIKDMVCLEKLTLSRTSIKELPEPPPSLKILTTHDCASLKTVTSTINIGLKFDFRNCFKLDQKQLIEAMHLKIQSGEEIPDGGIQMVLPGSEIPEWFGDKGVGSSVTIQLPSNCHQLKGIAFCLVFLGPLPFHEVYYNCHVKCKNDKHDEFDDFFFWVDHNVLVSCDSYHKILHYKLKLGNHLRKYSGNEVTFNFRNLGLRKVCRDIRRPLELKSWGGVSAL